jgi:hypothetical protein
MPKRLTNKSRKLKKDKLGGFDPGKIKSPPLSDMRQP